MAPAPIVLFAFARPEHLRRTLEALRLNALADRSPLIAYADAPRPGTDGTPVDAARAVLRGAGGFADVTIVERATHYGLSRNVVEGVTEVCDRYERVIVIEDDLVTSPWFLTYMNDALEHYADDARVVAAHGYAFDMPERLPETYFLRGADCWGWATWRRAWRGFNPDGAALLAALRERHLTTAFDLDGAFDYTAMLEQQVRGAIDSWAIRWHASAFLAGQLTLHPGRSLVRNIGLDGTGRHGASNMSRFDVEATRHRVIVGGVPIEESAAARAAVMSHLRRGAAPAGADQRASIWRRLRRWRAGR